MNNNQIRQATGRVIDSRPLVAFLYSLMRNSIPPRTIEKLVEESEKVGPSEPVLSFNDHLARYAALLADRLAPAIPASVDPLAAEVDAQQNETEAGSAPGIDHHEKGGDG